MKVLIIVGNTELEEILNEELRCVEGVQVEVLEDFSLVEEVLAFEQYDFLVLNTVLSPGKSRDVSQLIADREDGNKPKVIALIDSFENSPNIAQLAGAGVTAFVTFEQIEDVTTYLQYYPERFNWELLVPAEPQECTKDEVKKSTTIGSIRGQVTIGTFALSAGAGATTTAISIAERLESKGYQAAVLAMDGKSDLNYLEKGLFKANYIVPEKGEETSKLLELYGDGYDFLILDFGQIFQLTPEGILKTEYMQGKENAINEFKRCVYKIGLGFGMPWSIGKLEYFSNDKNFDMSTFLFFIKDLDRAVRKQYNLNFCNGLSGIINTLISWLGINKGTEKRTTLLPLFRK